MRRIYITLFAIMIAISAFSQENIIKISPFDLTYGRYNIQYERLLTEYTSASVSASYIRPNLFGLEDIINDFFLIDILEGTSLNGAALHFDYRIYSRKQTGSRGFYIATYLRYATIGFKTNVVIPDVQLTPEEKQSLSDIKTGFSINRFGYGLKFGAQWIIKDVFSIDWNFAGIGADLYNIKTFDYYYSDGEYNEDIFTDNSWRWSFATNFAIGYAF